MRGVGEGSERGSSVLGLLMGEEERRKRDEREAEEGWRTGKSPVLPASEALRAAGDAPTLQTSR